MCPLWAKIAIKMPKSARKTFYLPQKIPKSDV